MWSMVHRSLVGWGKHPPANLGLPTHEPAENLDENRGHEESHDPHRAPIPSLAQTRSPTTQLHTCRWVTVSLALIGCLPFVPSNRVPSKPGVSGCLSPFFPCEALPVTHLAIVEESTHIRNGCGSPPGSA